VPAPSWSVSKTWLGGRAQHFVSAGGTSSIDDAYRWSASATSPAAARRSIDDFARGLQRSRTPARQVIRRARPHLLAGDSTGQRSLGLQEPWPPPRRRRFAFRTEHCLLWARPLVTVDFFGSRAAHRGSASRRLATHRRLDRSARRNQAAPGGAARSLGFSRADAPPVAAPSPPAASPWSSTVGPVTPRRRAPAALRLL
jgi:hypothetical protein